MAKYPQWDGKVYKRAKFGDISIKGPAKEHERCSDAFAGAPTVGDAQTPPEMPLGDRLRK
jgi:hypothetical protein